MLRKWSITASSPSFHSLVHSHVKITLHHLSYKYFISISLIFYVEVNVVWICKKWRHKNPSLSHLVWKFPWLLPFYHYYTAIVQFHDDNCLRRWLIVMAGVSLLFFNFFLFILPTFFHHRTNNVLSSEVWTFP